MIRRDATLVAAPLRIEARALRRAAPGLRVVRTGTGPLRARAAVASLRATPARAFAVAGLCGGLDPDLAPGDVVVASALAGAVRQPTMPASLTRRLEDAGLRVHAVPLLSADHVVRGSERARLRAGGAHAVDMESAWLADAAGDRAFAVVRIVLDAPHHEILRPAFAGNLLRALRSLRRVAPILEAWGEEASCLFEPETHAMGEC